MAAGAKQQCDRIAARLNFVMAGAEIEKELLILQEATDIARQLAVDVNLLRLRWEKRLYWLERQKR